MISLEEALQQILGAVPNPGVESLAVVEARDRYTAAAVPSAADVPAFDNSAMDGYAVRSADVATAREEAPVWLDQIGRTAAGEPSDTTVAPGTCVRVFTGSVLPQGADAVVMQEDTRTSGAGTDPVAILCPVRPWESVRLRGEDIRTGALVVQTGQRLTPGHLAVLQAAGQARVAVARRPRVGILATGDELREPGQPLAHGCIYESNRAMLAALVAEAGAVPQIFPLVPDRLEATRDALRLALASCDAVLTSGGASVGDLDFVKPAMEAIGGSLTFWRVAMKPGKPFLFGRHESRLVFGLPGNPVSAFVTFQLLVRPALLRWQGAAAVAPPILPGTLKERLRNPGDRRHFVRVTRDAAGGVTTAGTQASHMLHSLAAANGLLDVAPGSDLPPGTEVKVLALALPGSA